MVWVVNATIGRFTPPLSPEWPITRAAWAPGPVLIGAENIAPTGIRSPVRAACHYTDWVIPALRNEVIREKMGATCWKAIDM